MTYLDRVRAEQERGARLQEVVNDDHKTGDLILAELRSMAEDRAGAERFPQYRGHFDEWVLVRISRTIETKLGVAFVAGDVTLGRRGTLPGLEDWTAFSFRTGASTGVGAGWATQVAG